MENTIELKQQLTITTSQAVAKPAAAARSRMAYIDTLRVVLTIIVIMVHAAVTYGSVGDWFYKDPVSNDLTGAVLSLFVVYSQAFFMGLFFFVSGYFTPGSIDRKGQLSFWKDRLLRLGLPMVVFTLLLVKIAIYIREANDGMTLSFWKFSTTNFWRSADSGPTWFLFALLVFSAAYSLWRLVGKRLVRSAVTSPRRLLPAPSTKVLLGFALVMAVSMLATSQVTPIGRFDKLFGAISLQYAFFPQYIMMFTAGILAYRNNWLAQWDGRKLRTWSLVSLGLILVFPVIFFLGGAAEGKFDAFASGIQWQSITLNLWIGLACVAFSMTLVLWLRDRKRQPSRLMSAISANQFAVYILHTLVLVPVTIWMSVYAIDPLVKFFLASALTLVACNIIAEILRRIPGLKVVL